MYSICSYVARALNMARSDALTDSARSARVAEFMRLAYVRMNLITRESSTISDALLRDMWALGNIQERPNALDLENVLERLRVVESPADMRVWHSQVIWLADQRTVCSVVCSKLEVAMALAIKNMEARVKSHADSTRSGNVLGGPSVAWRIEDEGYVRTWSIDDDGPHYLLRVVPEIVQ